MNKMDELEELIEKTEKLPVIVNENSRFVVTTYWWGRGNKNNNTARPCISYYESIVKRIISMSVDTVSELYKSKISIKSLKMKKQLEEIISSLSTFQKTIDREARAYVNVIYNYANLSPNESNKDDKAIRYLEKLKILGKTPLNYEYKNELYCKNFFSLIFKEIIRLNNNHIVALFDTKIQKDVLQNSFDMVNKTDKMEIEKFKRKLEDLKKKRTNILNDIKKMNNTKMNFPHIDESYVNMSIYDILNSELRYLLPIQYEEMIDMWENECRKNGVNYLSVEYPEFARPGGYQMAINAKPFFIKKALELCEGRSVLYIDGDMYIRKYPSLFDINDVDFMARGWWIDPRSSYQLTESIMYDPYKFETSGGTMFFSQSMSAKELIHLWIQETKKPYQAGKADDRILSLVFNTYKLLLKMKIIQLPVEYLWLSLDYDERMMEFVYDYDIPRMKDSIFIEHPECLTSEDTATGAGASSDRTPKFYAFLEELTPTVEEVYEYIMFPNKADTAAFRYYFDYMDEVKYMDDGNEDLVKRRYIQIPDSENESPLYVVKYDKKYGKRQPIVNKNMKCMKDIVIEYLVYKDLIRQISPDVYEVGPFSKFRVSMKTNRNMKKTNSNTKTRKTQKSKKTKKSKRNHRSTKKKKSSPQVSYSLICIILKLLSEGKTVIYNPENNKEYDVKNYNLLVNNMNTLYKDMEFVFTPIYNDSIAFSDFFKPEINIHQPILFRPTNRILWKYLSMFENLQEFSNYLNYQSYHFISRVRVGFNKYNVKGRNTNMITKAYYGGAMTEMKYRLYRKSRSSSSKYRHKKYGFHSATEYMKDYMNGLRILGKSPKR